MDYDRIVWYRAPARRQHVPVRLRDGEHLARVDVIATYAGADGALVRAAVAAGAKGLVVQALGWGNVSIPTYQAIKEVIGKGIPVVISTRVWNGRVLPNYGYEGGGKTLQQAGAIFGRILRRFARVRIAALIAIIVGAAAKYVTWETHASSPWIVVRWIMIAFLAVSLVVEILVFEPRLEALRTQLTPEMKTDDPQRAAFNVLHRRAENLLRLALLAAVVALFFS